MANLESRLKCFLKKHDRFKMYSIKPIPEAEYKCADILSNTMMLNTKEDYLLYYSSLILKSAKNKSIKQANKQKPDKDRERQSYSFKRQVAKGIESAIENDVDFLNFDMQVDDKGQDVVYVNLHGVQFSFHDVPFTPKMRWAKTANRRQYKPQTWEHTPLQNGATELFNYAIEQDNLSRIYYDGSGAKPREILTRERRRVKKQNALASASVGAANSAVQKSEKTSQK